GETIARRLAPRQVSCALASVGQREGDERVAALVVELRIAARRNDDVLLAVDGIGGWWGVDAGPGLEFPEHGARVRVISLKQAVALAGKGKSARRHQNAADHRLLRLDLPFDLAGVVVDRGDVAPLLLGGNDLEGAAQPELAL